MKHTIIVGSPCCGKTTLSGQLAIEDVDDGSKILIIDSLNEYSHKFLDQDTNSIKIFDLDDKTDIEFEFEKNVNLILLDELEIDTDLALKIIKKIFEYAEMYQINTVYMDDDILSYTLLEHIDDFGKFEDSFNIVTAIQSLNSFKNYLAIYKFFTELIVMKISLTEMECLKDNYLIKKRTLKNCLDFGLKSSFNIYNLY